MTDTITPDARTDDEADNEADDDAIAALAGRLFMAGLDSIELLTVYVGLRLDLYRPLASDHLSARELADRAGIHVRYAQEWLEQQTVAGFLVCDDRTAAADVRRYFLPAGHATVLLDGDHPACTSPLALALGGVSGVLPDLLEAYRRGTGVPYARYGADFREGQAGFNRPSFVNLIEDWLATGAFDVHQRLIATPPARVADVGCGCGWSSIALARAYPSAEIHGFDVDDASIADARRLAGSTGLSDRVRFEVRDATETDAASAGRFDLVTIFEAIHDMSQPVEALRVCRTMCAPGGAVIVMDERTADSFAESEGEIERFLYGASVLHCLPVGMAEQPSAATGTVMRASTLREYAERAGYASVEIMAIEHDLYRFYRLNP
jgi:2-polyprenyl-3-methyl-5-hydroxy-6-metoxy-1,4-benzoquinol methylase